MIVLVAVTGIRSGEMLGLRWRDILWDRSEMKDQADLRPRKNPTGR